MSAGFKLLVTGTDHRDIGQDVKTLPRSPCDVLLCSAVSKTSALIAYYILYYRFRGGV